MPAIRKEMRVSHKLCPEIVGPTLQTATEILDSAYSKKTREKQQVSFSASITPEGASEARRSIQNGAKTNPLENNFARRCAPQS